MKKATVWIGIVMASLLALSAHAATKEEAKAMADKAIAYIEKNGLEKAKTEIKNKDGEFIKGELYVFIMDMEGKMISHGVKDRLDGKSLLKLKTPDGVYFIQEMIKVIKEKGEGWVEYVWAHPKTGKVTPKSTYVKKPKDKDIYVACGVYTE
mgnify:CR=1 FL=1